LAHFYVNISSNLAVLTKDGEIRVFCFQNEQLQIEKTYEVVEFDELANHHAASL